MATEGGAADRTGEDADEGDPDLDHRQEGGGILEQTQGHRGAAIARPRPLPKAGATRRHQGQLGHRQRSVHEHQGKHERDLEQKGHGLLFPRGRRVRLGRHPAEVSARDRQREPRDFPSGLHAARRPAQQRRDQVEGDFGVQQPCRRRTEHRPEQVERDLAQMSRQASEAARQRGTDPNDGRPPDHQRRHERQDRRERIDERLGECGDRRQQRCLGQYSTGAALLAGHGRDGQPRIRGLMPARPALRRWG